MNINMSQKKLLLIPAVLAFIIALLLVYKYSFPISWDVYYHIHMAELYSDNGLVFRDLLTSAPEGRTIMYPPLFHLFLATLSSITNLSIINVCRLLEPFFSLFLVFSVSFSTYKLTDVKTGIVAGFLTMLCFVTFNRSVITTPATIAIGFFMISCVYFYLGFKENNIYYISISAILLGLIGNLHMATVLITIGVLGLYSIVQILRRKISIKYLVYFIILASIIALPWWIYIYLNYPMVFNSVVSSNVFIGTFFATYYGFIPLFFTIIGFYKLFKNFSEKTLFLSIWIFSLILLSQVYLINIDLVSIRMLEVASYPMILVASIGFIYLYEYLKNIKLRHVLIIALIFLSVLSALVYTDSYTPDVLADDDYNTTLLPESVHKIVTPISSTYKPSIISLRYGDPNMAHDRYDVLEWFVDNSDSKSILVSQDSIMDTIIVSTSRTRVIYGGFTESIPSAVVDPVHIIENRSTAQEIHDLNVGYLLLDKDTPVPIYAQVVHENSHYKICTIKDTYRDQEKWLI